jgi:hypothetical protein
MYATVEEADEFLAMELWTDIWFASSSTMKTKAMNKATRIIDRLKFIGVKTDETQPNEFPRNGETEVPQDVKEACCYIALALMEGKIPELEYDNARVESDSIVSGKVSYNTTNTPKTMLYGVPSYDAWGLLVKYVDLAGLVKVIRVS